MDDNPFAALTFIVGPAILTNACAIMQNSATMRYSLAISQWREFRASLGGTDDQLPRLYANGQAALRFAERRLRLLLHGLDLLYAAVGLFGAASLLGLAGAVLEAVRSGIALPVTLVVVFAAAGIVALLCAAVLFMGESACARAMLALQLKVHPQLAEGPDFMSGVAP